MNPLRSLDIRSKIILALLLVGGVSTVITALLGYQSGQRNLTDRITVQLSSLAAITAAQVEAYFEGAEGRIETLSRDLMVLDAMRDFREAAGALDEAAPSPAARARLVRFYEEDFLPTLVAPGGGEPVTTAYLPVTPAGLALQAAYVGGAAGAAPGTRYRAVHERYHEAFSALVVSGGFADVFLIAPDGFVAYSVLKEPDFATSLMEGPYADTGLARAFRAARAGRGTRFVHVEDYAFYDPSAGAPAAFFATPLTEGGRFLGVLALQLDAERLDAIVNQGGRWREVGLGETGEVFLVGADMTLRTVPRPFVEAPETFLSEARRAGTDGRTLSMIEAHGTPVLLQEAASPSVRAALRGETGVRTIARDYGGREALSAAMPLSVAGLDWAVVAEMPTTEAYAPIDAFGRRITVVAAMICLAVTALAMILAALLMAPVRKLIARAKAVRDGDLGTRVALDRQDEFGELSRELQALVDDLRARSDEARASQAQAQSLLSRFLPARAVRLLRSRDFEAADHEALAEPVDGVSVVALRVAGMDAVAKDATPQARVAVTDRLWEALDALAERHGLEKARAGREAYLAAAGLSAPLPDHRRRALTFAEEAVALVERNSEEAGVSLSGRAGVASGTVLVGIVGHARLTFDLWGEPVRAAEAMARDAAAGEVRTEEAAHAGADADEPLPA